MIWTTYIIGAICLFDASTWRGNAIGATLMIAALILHVGYRP